MWTAGLPKSIPVHDIAIQQRDNEIVLGTHGRSLFVAKLDSVQLLLKSVEYRQKQQSGINKSSASARVSGFGFRVSGSLVRRENDHQPTQLENPKLKTQNPKPK